MSAVDLNDDCLRGVLQLLPIKEKIKLERVSAQFKRVIDGLLRSQTVITFSRFADQHPKCIHADLINVATDQVDCGDAFMEIIAKRRNVDELLMELKHVLSCNYLMHACYDFKSGNLSCVSFEKDDLNPNTIEKLTSRATPLYVDINRYPLHLLYNSVNKQTLTKLVINAERKLTFTEQECNFIGELVNLKSLVVDAFPVPFQDELVPVLMTLNNLEEVTINVSYAHQAFGAFIVKQNSKLRSLKIGGITDNELQLICEHAKNLTKLCVASVTGNYPQVCLLRNLRELELNYTNCIKRGCLNENELHAILENCPKLHTINLPGCYFHYQEEMDKIFSYENNVTMKQLVWFARLHRSRQIHASLGFDVGKHYDIRNLKLRYRFTHQCHAWLTADDQ